MTICDSCFGKDKTIKQSFHTVSFHMVESNAPTVKPDKVSEFHLCYECHKQLQSMHILVAAAIKSLGAIGTVQKLREMY